MKRRVSGKFTQCNRIATLVWKTKGLELIPRPANRSQKIVVQFGPQGTDQTNEIRTNNLMRFVKQYRELHCEAR